MGRGEPKKEKWEDNVTSQAIQTQSAKGRVGRTCLFQLTDSVFYPLFYFILALYVFLNFNFKIFNPQTQSICVPGSIGLHRTVGHVRQCYHNPYCRDPGEIIESITSCARPLLVWGLSTPKSGPGVNLHAGKLLLEFPWRILDNSGMPLSSPISDIFNALGKRGR
jgi:hypothetical protein